MLSFKSIFSTETIHFRATPVGLLVDLIPNP
jgi:hypothetical protein